MSRDFEWRFGDELPERAVDEGQPQPRSWRRWWIGLLVLLLVGGSAYAWWHQRQRTLDAAEAKVQQVARLELRALAEGDVELYMSLQDGADDAWREAQAAYTATAALPLPIEGLTKTQTSVGSARVVGDRAEVAVIHTASLPNGRQASFHAVRFYRYTDGGRWVHTRRDPSAGGETVVLVGDFVELFASERDADWVEPVVSQLEDVAYRFCDLVSCQQGLPGRLDLSGGLGEQEVVNGAALPAPYLIGAPQDEAAYEAWKAALQTLFLDRLIAGEMARATDEVAGELFEDRLRAWFAAKLGVDHPILADVDPLDDALLRVSRSDSWIPLAELYRVSVDDPRVPLAKAQIDLLLDFLERRHGASAVAGLILPPEGDDDVQDLLEDLVEQPWSEFELRYFGYLREATAERVDDLEVFTSYDFVTACQGPVDPLLELRGLRLDQPVTTLLSAGSEGQPLLPLAWSPDGAYLLLRHQVDDGMYALLPEASATPRPIRRMPEDAEIFVSWTGLGETGWSPDGLLVAYRVVGQPVGGGFVNVRSGERVTFEGDFVGWSCDSSRLIYAQPVPWHWSPELRIQTFWVWDRNGGQSRRLGRGYVADWSPDGARIAYVTPEPALRSFHALTGETLTHFDMESLRRTLGFTPTLSPISGRPFDIAWSPNGEWIALGATRSIKGGSEETLTLLVRDGSHRVLGRQNGGLLRLSWSPDGHWLTTFTFARGQSRVVVSNVQGDVLFEGEDAFVSWSPEGKHMAVVQGRRLRILETESAVWKTLEVPGSCWPAVWNPRPPLDEAQEKVTDLIPWPDWRTSIQACDVPHCQP